MKQLIGFSIPFSCAMIGLAAFLENSPLAKGLVTGFGIWLPLAIMSWFIKYELPSAGSEGRE